MSNILKTVVILAGLSFVILHACSDSKVTGTENDTDNSAVTDTTGMDHWGDDNDNNDGDHDNNPWQKELLISSFAINGEEILVNEESARPDEIRNYINYDNLPGGDYQMFSVTVHIPVGENGDYQTDLQENHINLLYSEGVESDDLTINIASVGSETIDGAEYSTYVVEGWYSGLDSITRYSFEELIVNVDVVYLNENEGEVNRREVEYSVYVKGEAPPEEMNWNVITLNSSVYDDTDWKDMNKDGLIDYVANKGDQIEVFYNQAGANLFSNTPDITFSISDLPDLPNDIYGTPRNPKGFDEMVAIDWDGDSDGDVLVKLNFNWIDSQRPYPSLIMLENEAGVLQMYNGSSGLLPFGSYDLESSNKVDAFSRFSSEDIDDDGDDDVVFFTWFGDYDEMTLEYIENNQDRMGADVLGDIYSRSIHKECLVFSGGGFGNAYIYLVHYAVHPSGIYISSRKAILASCGNYIRQEFYPEDGYTYSKYSTEGDIDGDGINEFFILHSANRITMTSTDNLNLYSSFEVTGITGRIDLILALDINKDSYDDLIVMPTLDGQRALFYLISSGNGTFQAPRQITLSQEQFNSGNMRAYDINGDGCEDMATKENVLLNPCL